jgi:hypothetical protein
MCIYIPASVILHVHTHIHTYIHTHTYMHAYMTNMLCVFLIYAEILSLVGVTANEEQVRTCLHTHMHTYMFTLDPSMRDSK